MDFSPRDDRTNDAQSATNQANSGRMPSAANTTNTINNPKATNTTGTPGISNAPNNPPQKSSSKPRGNKVFFALSIVFSVSLVMLAIFTIIGIATRTSEQSYVNTDDYQAVFLTSGQVYFGHISDVNDHYMIVQDIFYPSMPKLTIQPDPSPASNQTIALTKLGCERHGPNDVMIINRDSISFWENLRADGAVTTAIGDWIKEHPNGQTCQAPTSNPAN